MKLAIHQRRELTSATLTQTLGLMAGCSALLILTAYASDPTAWNDPAWWSAPGPNGLSAVMPEQVITNAITGVVTTNYIADNSAAVTQGQLKKFTVRAVDELNSGLSGGAGSDLSSMVSNWAQDYATNGFNATNPKPSDSTAMTVGQLKYIGNKVWSQLVAAGYTNAVPSWLAQNTSTDNELANIGQLKEIFNFSPSVAPPAAPSNLTVTASNPGELDLIWTNNASNATSITIKMSADGGLTWTNVTTLTDATINSYAVTGLSSGSNYQFQVTANNTAGPSPTTTTTSPPSPPVPRYAVIDFGTNFFPAGINNSGAVVGQIGANNPFSSGPGNGVPGIWNWASNTNQPLPVNSSYQIPATNYWVVGIDDAGHIAGNISFDYLPIPADLPSTSPYWVEFGWLGSYWTNSTSTPIALGQGESSDNGNFALWESLIEGISDQGYMAGFSAYDSGGNLSPSHVESFSPTWMVGTSNEAQVLYPPYPESATNYPGGYLGLDTNAWATGVGGAGNWCGEGYTFNYGYYHNPTSPIINGTMYTAYGNLSLGAINDASLAAGSFSLDSSGTNNMAAIVSPASGTTLAITNLGPGVAAYLNNQLATNGAPAPEVIGYASNSPPAIPMLWDKTTYAATAYTNAATGNYLGKTLSLLLPGTTNSPWTMTGISGINNAGSIIGSANYTPQGTNDTTPAGPHGVELLPVQINHADGTNQDQPMAYLPQWTPNNGSGRGQPIYHTPTAVLQMSSIGTTMAATFLGQSYTLTQNGSNPLLYQDATSGLSILLAAAPLNDPSVQESLQATVNLSSAGVNSGVYVCNETTASSNVFQDVTPGIGIGLAGLDPTTADTMTLTITGDTFSNSVTLTETGPNTLTFTGSGITVQLVNSSTVGGTLYAALTYSAYGYSNTVMPVSFVSTGQYQNFAPPTPTDQTAESVDSFASFYIQLPVGLGSTPSVDLSVQVNGSDVDFGTVDLVSTGNNMWRSAKKLVMLSAGADTSQMTSADSSNFQTLQLPAGVNLDWTKGGGIVNVLLNGVVGQTTKPSFPVKAQANGVALESLGFTSWFGQGIDVEGRIRQPFLGMGYTMDSDYSATTPNTLSTYVKGGKQIWYSISHGMTEDGTPSTAFHGLAFKDFKDQGFITAAALPGGVKYQLLPDGLNYRLTIIDGCSSAQTSLASEAASQSANTVLGNCTSFADKFGSKVAYMGWSWEEPPTIQQWTGEFVGDLKGKGVTVKAAYNTFLSAHPGNAAVTEMKIYGNTGAIIDLSSNPNATSSGSGP